MLNIKAKYQEIEEKKKRKKFTIRLQSLEAIILAVCTVQLIAFLMLTQQGKAVQKGIEDTAVNAVYDSVTSDVYNTSSANSSEDDSNDANDVLDSLLKEGLKSK